MRLNTGSPTGPLVHAALLLFLGFPEASLDVLATLHALIEFIQATTGKKNVADSATFFGLPELPRAIHLARNGTHYHFTVSAQ